MALQNNDKITYKDLTDYVLTLIKTKCSNIDAFASNVPSTLKNGGTWTIATKTSNKRNGGDGSEANGNKPAMPITYASVTVTATGTVNDAVLSTVSNETVKSQLDSFLTSRGIATKSEEVVSFKGIMNFYNNISSFLATKLVYVTNSFNAGTFIFYNSSASSYPSTNIGHNDINFSNDEIKTSLDDIINAINNVSNVHYASTTINYASSSSSSSSSTFIAYMDI